MQETDFKISVLFLNFNLIISISINRFVFSVRFDNFGNLII